jgi:uncharacterized protein (DUF2062 family)
MAKKRKTPHAVRARRKQKSFYERMRRLMHYQLIIPMLRSKHAPEYTARSVAIGFAVGITPTAGLQLISCALAWIIAKKIFKWDFNVILAMAWTWNSNTFTIPPIYYICFVTGQIMLGNWHDVFGYQAFAQHFEGIFDLDLSWDSVGDVADFLVTGVFLKMMLGSIPWFVLSYWVFYRWTMRFMERYHLARSERQAQKRSARQGAGG